MSEISEQISTQLLVPAYVWHDDEPRQGALTKIGVELGQLATRNRMNVNMNDASVQPYGLKATVCRIDIGKTEPASFVGYDLCDVEQADLVMIVVSVPLVS